MTTGALLVHGFGSNTHTWDGLDEQLTIPMTTAVSMLIPFPRE